MQQKLRQFIRKCESGMDTTWQGIGYITLMVVLLALVWDFGRLVYINSICLNAARIAAQDAAKQIDKNKFLDSQEIDLLDTAQGNAEATFRALTDISVQVDVDLVEAADTPRGRLVFVSASVPVKLIMLGNLFESPHVDAGGNPDRPNPLREPIVLIIEAYAEPAYGIDEEIQ